MDNDTKEYRAWTFFQKLMVALGPDGMSSDESDHDLKETERGFQVKIMFWRKDAHTEMEKIDNEGFFNKDLRSGRGAKVVQRFRKGVQAKSSREAPVGLSEGLYNPQWVKEMESSDRRYHELKFFVSEAKFRWIDWESRLVNSRVRREPAE